MYIHASGVMVLTPDGRIARYLYGVDYEPKDFELALVEASRGKIGSLADTILLYCYHYDPTSGKYTTTVLGILRLAGILTLLLMAVAGMILWRFDLRRHRNRFSEVRYR
jgi:protein SCO1/2